MTDNQRKFLSSAKEVAKQMGKNGRSLTGVIGELSASEKLGLKWEPTDGYDATDKTKEYQIKTRKNWTDTNKKKSWWQDNKVDPNGRINRFEGKGNYNFYVDLYVELDDDFEVWGIWQCERSTLMGLEHGTTLGLKVGKFQERGVLGN
ncbi:hypothetical protein FIM12_07620 [SAR202 cluster bacterium AD-804-J14_MRT_500m]|nr:hypothetical protein [SAR202 cluster bacterium AD-804-J14_MRT_500m]